MLNGKASARAAPADRSAWLASYAAVRARTLELASPLSAEVQQVQSMADVSPTKWLLAHVTWFFETFLLSTELAGYQPFNPAFGYLFNSYYEQVGDRHPRPQRGLLTRPSIETVRAYRTHVDAAMRRLVETCDGEVWTRLRPLIELGLNHEQQHQELLLMDIKHVLSVNPLQPAYHAAEPCRPSAAQPLTWSAFDGGLCEIGWTGEGFAFDNEGPRHKVWLEPFRLADRLATCGEFLEFIDEGGYRRPELWLSDGWAAVQREGWTAPLYWTASPDGQWRVFTLAGPRALVAAEPVSHLSQYEADAFARWSGARLPTEAEWEVAASSVAFHGHLADRGVFHPRAAQGDSLSQMIGDLWEWTASPYVAYPRYRPARGALGEYNGKFMSGQMVLRGGSAVTPADHLRVTYRNFFPPSARWAFSGVRLAADAG
jgi:ergothioneine biosynthesis protein EgtB